MVVIILHTLLAFSAVANLMIGIIVLSRRKDDNSARLFAFTTFAAFLWSAGILLVLIFKSSIFFFDQLAHIGGAFCLALLGLYISSLARLRQREWFLLLVYFLGNAIFFSIAVFIPKAFIYSTPVLASGLAIETYERGPLQTSFLLFGVFSFILYIVLLMRAHKHAQGIEKQQIKSIAIGTIFASFMGIGANLVLPTFNVPVFNGIGPISSLVLTGNVTYTIIKQDVFRIRLLITELIIFSFISYMGALIFLSVNFSDVIIRFTSLLITIILSIVLLRSFNRETHLRAEVEQTYQKQSNFLADIAHKLKTPLTIVKINNDMAKISIKSKEYGEAEESVNKSIQAVNRLARMSTNLVTLGKIDFGLSKLEKHQFDLSALISSSVSDFKPMLGSRKMESAVEPDINFYGDSSRVQEMLYNLLDNSVKFTDAEQGIIEVSLQCHSVLDTESKSKIKLDSGVRQNDRYNQVLDSRLRSPRSRSGVAGGNDKRGDENNTNKKSEVRSQKSVQVKDKDTIVLTISDNGSGIKKEDLPHLFDRYYQGEERSGSAGIGLAICKWIVTGHNGRIKIESELGKGTLLRIIFNT